MEVKPTRILHLLPSWEHVGALRRIAMLAAHLGRPACEFDVVALSARGPDPRLLLGAGFPSHTALAAGRRLRLPLAWPLRRVIHDRRAEIVHAWMPSAARLARVAMLGLHDVRLIETDPRALPIGIDVERLRHEVGEHASRAVLLESLGLPAGARLLGTCGRLAREKRLAELLWALDQIRCVREDVYLLVVGDGDFRPLYERYARLYEIADHVRFLGWQSDARALIAGLDVYCSASGDASPSFAMLEAMALGAPVVASDTPAHRSLVVPGETGLLADVRQRSEMARWCLRVLEDSELAGRMREAARRRAVERFPIEPFVEAHRRLYGLAD